MNYTNAVFHMSSNSYLIAISGQSCSGKSYVTKRVAETARHIFNPNMVEFDINDNISKLQQDSYYNGGNENTNFDEPSSIDWDLMIKHIIELKNGNPIDVPIYNFETHSRTEKTERIYPSKVLIIEGTMVLTIEKIRSLCNLKVYVSACPELMYMRRLKRDVRERGRSEEEVNIRYFRDVVPSAEHYTKPTMQYADIILMNNNNNHQFVGLSLLLDHVEKKVQTLK
ncbi:phosphoribulokinase / Uridine kinase family protein [Indivirus ILV1]|uniref:uridine/cytidine kinase n=1 Tax=Indivirus ILV1 TaxID=1977633 RepID=A0A1V0SD85_9VIRU|nr:phosphoribulokinase / Uridine kinase family protein [Indivirus ILV1]